MFEECSKYKIECRKTYAGQEDRQTLELLELLSEQKSIKIIFVCPVPAMCYVTFMKTMSTEEKKLPFQEAALSLVCLTFHHYGLHPRVLLEALAGPVTKVQL